MRRLALAALLMAASADAATVPQTSEAQNLVSPPESGKLAYRLSDAESAILYVGEDGRAVAVSDPFALRSERTAPYPAKAYDVDPGAATVGEHDGHVTYAAAEGATLTVTMLDGRAIGEVTWRTGGSSGLIPGSADGAVTIDGPVATIDLKTANGGFAYDIQVFAPSVERVNDTTARDFVITDRLGTYRLSTLRAELLRHHDGNRGEDWADYPAKSRVKANGKAIWFGGESGASILPKAGGLALSVLSAEALTISAASGEAPATGEIAVTDISVGDGSVAIDATVTGIDASGVSVHAAEALDDAFIPTPSAMTSLGGDAYRFTVARAAGASHFYRLVADGGVTSVTVRVSGDLEVTGDLILASPNGTRYRVSVSDDGTLTAAREE